MSSFLRKAVVLSLAFLPQALLAVQLESANKDAVKLGKGPYWNLQTVEQSSTIYKLTGKGGVELSSLNYGIVDIGGNAYDLMTDKTLTQGACNTLWGSATNLDVALYAAYADSQGTSTSNSAPSTDISGGSDTSLKIAVDKNPVITVTLSSVAGLDTGAEIASALTEAINTALAAALQGGRVDVAYANSLYVITSRLGGVRSSVVVTAATSNNVADNLKLGTANSGVEVAGSKGVQLCVSDQFGKTTVGSAALGSTGYMSCGATLPSTSAVRQIAQADLNCSGPVIGTVTQRTVTESGFTTLPIKKYGSVSSTTTGSANLVFTVRGLEAGAQCVISPTALGTGPAYLASHAVTANTITAVADATQSGGTTTITYACW